MQVKKSSGYVPGSVPAYMGKHTCLQGEEYLLTWGSIPVCMGKKKKKKVVFFKPGNTNTAVIVCLFLINKLIQYIHT